MAMTRSYKVGDEIPPLTKTMTQEAINLFEKSGGATGPSQFTDAETALEMKAIEIELHRLLSLHLQTAPNQLSGENFLISRLEKSRSNVPVDLQ